MNIVYTSSCVSCLRQFGMWNIESEKSSMEVFKRKSTEVHNKDGEILSCIRDENSYVERNKKLIVHIVIFLSTT